MLFRITWMGAVVQVDSHLFKKLAFTHVNNNLLYFLLMTISFFFFHHLEPEASKEAKPSVVKKGKFLMLLIIEIACLVNVKELASYTHDVLIQKLKSQKRSQLRNHRKEKR